MNKLEDTPSPPIVFGRATSIIFRGALRFVDRFCLRRGRVWSECRSCGHAEPDGLVPAVCGKCGARDRGHRIERLEVPLMWATAQGSERILRLFMRWRDEDLLVQIYCPIEGNIPVALSVKDLVPFSEIAQRIEEEAMRVTQSTDRTTFYDFNRTEVVVQPVV